jgi:Holliday junction resolvasome RuvABC endonuclease subunit|tara:strand:+ start:701 stop:1222 length:522 start_codon:yes stop_codon:yes gene_type:complete
MILGLDISTSRIGYSIIDYNKKLIIHNVIKFKPLQLEDRAEIFYQFLTDIKKQYKIKDIFIEQPFMMFSGGKTTAMTMSKLQRFNGMCSFAVRRIFNLNPTLIAANKARGLVGLKIKRGEDTKKKIIEWVEKKYPKDFIVELTNYGNPRPGTDDKADAIVIALAGLEILNEKT